MTNPFPWILIVVAVILAILLILVLILRKKYNNPPDYYAFFWMGLIWILFGLLTVFNKDYIFSGLGVMGLVFFAIGLANKDKWKLNRRRWKDFTPAEKKFKIWLIVILSLLMIPITLALLIDF